MQTLRRAAYLVSLLLTATMSVSEIAYGVALAAHVEAAVETDSVVPGVAVRARADVQIRRIKSLLVSKKADVDSSFERLEKLQKDLRGER